MVYIPLHAPQEMLSVVCDRNGAWSCILRVPATEPGLIPSKSSGPLKLSNHADLEPFLQPYPSGTLMLRQPHTGSPFWDIPTAAALSHAVIIRSPVSSTYGDGLLQREVSFTSQSQGHSFRMPLQRVLDIMAEATAPSEGAGGGSSGGSSAMPADVSEGGVGRVGVSPQKSPGSSFTTMGGGLNGLVFVGRLASTTASPVPASEATGAADLNHVGPPRHQSRFHTASKRSMFTVSEDSVNVSAAAVKAEEGAIALGGVLSNNTGL